MARRVVTPEIFEDEWFGGLQDREQLVWVGLFAARADDQGRLLDNPILIRARLWPYRDVPVADVSAALDRFVCDGRLHRADSGDCGHLFRRKAATLGGAATQVSLIAKKWPP